MSNRDEEDDLNLLLSLQEDRVLETPPPSPSNNSQLRSPGYDSEDGDDDDDERRRRRSGDADMSVFKDAVQDCMDYDAKAAKIALKSSSRFKASSVADVEKFSGLRIRNQTLSTLELSNRFSDIRFVRLSSIRNLIRGDTLMGHWATVGVLTEKGNPKVSSSGKNYCIWKLGSLDEQTLSVFLFGDAYQKHCKEPAGTVFGLFYSSVRKDPVGTGFSLSIYNPNQVLKMGTSADYGVCKGKRKDGMPCSMVINKRRGIYCSYHRSQASQKYSVKRSELKGGNLKTAFRDPFRPIRTHHVADPLGDKVHLMYPKQPAVLMSVEGLKKALSNADRVTTVSNSQGIRILTKLAGTIDQKNSKKEPGLQNHRGDSVKRSASTTKLDYRLGKTRDLKRTKPEPVQASSQETEKMIELDFVSSDEEM